MANTDTKKYYWLKLYSDFFTSKRIKKLRKLAGGDTYTIIYLKMQLLALGTNGYISYSELENSLASELALDIDEKEDDIQVVLNFLLQYKLMEKIDDNTYLLPFVVECTGSETGKAIRLRKARRKSSEEKNNKNTYGEYSNINLTVNEYEKLIKEFGEEKTKKAVNYLDEYIEEKGYKSKSHYLAIRRWVMDAISKNNKNDFKDKLPIYDTTKNKKMSEDEMNELLKLQRRS